MRRHQERKSSLVTMTDRANPSQDWKRRGENGVVIHGWVYHLEDVSNEFAVSTTSIMGLTAIAKGKIRDLQVSVGPLEHIHDRSSSSAF